jgi:hypothetical protein
MPLNPFRSEAEAYRFVWLTIGYFGLIVAGALINRWLGLAVFIVLSAIVVFSYVRRGERRTRVVAPRHRGAEDERRILVIANETVGGETLRRTIREHSAAYREQVLVVTPALNSPLKHWVSDEDEARAAAHERLERSLAAMRAAGIEARGEIGDVVPKRGEALARDHLSDQVGDQQPEEQVALDGDEACGRPGVLAERLEALLRQRVDGPLARLSRLLSRSEVPEAREPLRLRVVLALACPVQDPSALDHPSKLVRRGAGAPDEAQDLVGEEAQVSP